MPFPIKVQTTLPRREAIAHLIAVEIAINVGWAIVNWIFDIHPVVEDVGYLALFIAVIFGVAWYLSRKPSSGTNQPEIEELRRQLAVARAAPTPVMTYGRGETGTARRQEEDITLEIIEENSYDGSEGTPKVFGGRRGVQVSMNISKKFQRTKFEWVRLEISGSRQDTLDWGENHQASGENVFYWYFHLPENLQAGTYDYSVFVYAARQEWESNERTLTVPAVPAE